MSKTLPKKGRPFTNGGEGRRAILVVDEGSMIMPLLDAGKLS
jgi:hypothetical protein